MLNNSAIIFYDNYGLVIKGSEDKATNGTDNWSLSTTICQLTPSRSRTQANIHIDLILPDTRLPRKHFCH